MGENFVHFRKVKLTKQQEERMATSIKIGLPNSLRGRIWEYLVKVDKYKQKSEKMYENYLNKPNDGMLSHNFFISFTLLMCRKD